MNDKDNRKHKNSPKSTDTPDLTSDNSSVLGLSKDSVFYIDEETSHASLRKQSKERTKYETTKFTDLSTNTMDEQKENLDGNISIGPNNIDGDKNFQDDEITLERVGINRTPKRMVVRSTGIILHAKGLINKKNDCFLNATLQVLLSIKSFADYYYATNEQKPFTRALKEFIHGYSSGQSMNPDKLKGQLRSKFNFMDGNEQDAHEFLVSFLNELYMEQGGTDLIITNLDELETVKDRNFIARTFYGMQKNIIRCGKCRKANAGFQEMSILSCELQPNVEKVLAEYTKSEKICFDCPKCGRVQGDKSFEIVSHPKYMIIHLKRFNQNGKKNYTKIDVCQNYCFYDSHYRLLGAIVHIGDCDSGHYYSEALRNGKWKRFDDMLVTDIEENKNDLRDSYILFYEKYVKVTQE